jgi:hypothetical protein
MFRIGFYARTFVLCPLIERDYHLGGIEFFRELERLAKQRCGRNRSVFTVYKDKATATKFAVALSL